MFVTYILYSRRVTTRSLVSLTKREKNAHAVLANFPRGLFIKPCARRAKCMHAETRFGESSSLPPHRAGSIYAKATIGHEIQFVRARARTMGEIPIRARERESIRRIVGGKIIPWKFRDKARAVVCVYVYGNVFRERREEIFPRELRSARARHDSINRFYIRFSTEKPYPAHARSMLFRLFRQIAAASQPSPPSRYIFRMRWEIRRENREKVFSRVVDGKIQPHLYTVCATMCFSIFIRLIVRSMHARYTMYVYWHHVR